jgi:hypothetical protein
MDNRFANASDADDANALSAYWDSIARGDSAPASDGIDPDTFVLIQRIQRASRSHIPAGARDRGMEAVMQELVGRTIHLNGHDRRSTMSASVVLPEHPGFGPTNGRKAYSDWQRAARSFPVSRRRSTLLMAAVALLLLALSGPLGTIRSDLFDPNEDRIVSIPAAQVSPSPESPSVVLLHTLVIPAEHLPTGEISTDTFVYTQDVGTTETFDELTAPVSIEVVLNGSYGTTSEDPRLIWRGGNDAPPEEVAPGDEAIVEAGDFIAYLGNSTQTGRVIGDDRVLAFGINIFGDGGEIGATGDATLRLQRVSLEPGASLLADDSHIERFVESGVLNLEITRAGASTPGGSFPYSDIVPYTPLPAGTKVVVRNDGDVPLVFLEAIITLPPEDGTPAAGTPAN